MKPPEFEYVWVQTCSEAVSLLAEYGDDAKLIAGGQSLMPMLNFRVIAPEILIDIGGLGELQRISACEGGIRIGAGVTHEAIGRSRDVGISVPALQSVVPHIAHLAIRNRGTFGGSLSHADPAAEWPLMCVLLDAEMVVTSARGERLVKADDFFVDALTTSLADDEILLAVKLPETDPLSGFSFHEVSRREGDFAITACAALISINNATVSAARVAIGGVEARPTRMTAVETGLTGRKVADINLDNLVHRVGDTLQPLGDIHASQEYRAHLAQVLIRRAVADAIGNATSARGGE